MTHGTIAGLLLPDLIEGKDHPWEELYDPARVRASSLFKWAGENLNAAAQYASHLSPGELSSPDELKPGEGGILRRGLSKVAVYRAADGALIERSAVCTHLGALVCWNAAEKTWDCPAHGSRFAPDGSVLNGPAAQPLPPAKGSSRARKRAKASGSRARGRRATGKRPARRAY
jgi:nitrite reductase/ring-hydroxylating ferredoxin subunit